MASTEKINIVVTAKDRASGVLKGISGSLTSLAKIAVGGALAGVATLGAGFAAILAPGLRFNNAMEQASARINAFTKDAGKTAEILDMVRGRAERTPFAFEEMASATAALMPTARAANTGLEGLLETAEILAASNPAQGLEGAAFSLKEAVSGDFVSIIERFNLPRQMINKLKDEGVPALEIVKRSMESLGLDTGLVAALAETASGRWSTFTDILKGLSGQVTGQVFESFSEGLGMANVALDEAKPKLTEFAETVGTKLGEISSVVIPAFVDTIIALMSGDMLTAIVGTGQALGNVFGQDFGQSFIDFALNAVIAWGNFKEAVAPAVDNIKEKFGGLREAWQNLIDLFPELQSTIGGLTIGEMVAEDIQLVAAGIERITDAINIAVGLIEQWREMVRLTNEMAISGGGNAATAGIITGVTGGNTAQSELALDRAGELIQGVSDFFTGAPEPANIQVDVTLDGADIANSINVRQGQTAAANADMGGRANQ